MKLRAVTADEVEFEDTFEEETADLRNDKVAREHEDEMIERLERGDITAWCILAVRVHWKGHTGYAALCGYTFPEGRTGIQNQEYASEDMAQLRIEALEDLNRTLQEQADLLEGLRA